jgi:hypothetical protein
VFVLPLKASLVSRRTFSRNRLALVLMQDRVPGAQPLSRHPAGDAAADGERAQHGRAAEGLRAGLPPGAGCPATPRRGHGLRVLGGDDGGVRDGVLRGSRRAELLPGKGGEGGAGGSMLRHRKGRSCGSSCRVVSIREEPSCERIILPPEQRKVGYCRITRMCERRVHEKHI